RASPRATRRGAAVAPNRPAVRCESPRPAPQVSSRQKPGSIAAQRPDEPALDRCLNAHANLLPAGKVDPGFRRDDNWEGAVPMLSDTRLIRPRGRFLSA